MKQHSVHECHNIAEDCPYPIHVYSGMGPNYIFVFHFDNQEELTAFLVNQQWNETQIAQLRSVGEVRVGNEWAKEVTA